jgi:hypothetical protein
MTPTTLPVPGFPGYFASDDGRVFSERRWRGNNGPRELAGGVNAHGYRQVILCDNGVRTVREVHAIIAATFHGPRPAGLDTRHLDGDKSNNAASNLRYGTRSENELDKVRHRQMRNAA